jgi:hypothetical protein
MLVLVKVKMIRVRPDSGAHHEHLTSSEAVVKVSSDRCFGVVFAAFFALVWILPTLRGRSVRWWALGVSLLFLFIALASPRALHPLNLLWAKLAVLLHHIVSPAAMALVFFLAFTPMGFLLRAFGKDVLRLRRSPNADSYWIPRDPQGPPPETMIHQF